MVAVWVIVAVCASYGSTGRVAALVIVALNICLISTVRGIRFFIDEQSRRDWQDRLTNRFFYQLFWESLKSDQRPYLDIDQLFREAGQKAVADIKSVAEEETLGFLDKTWWHLLGGVLHFLGSLVGDVLYYGSAIWIGANRPL
jgi:hypothetical protein